MKPIAAALLAIAMLAPRAPLTRTIYITALDTNGAPITDITPDDLIVKEAGREQKIDAVRLATSPMDVSLIVDDGGTGAFQPAAAEFINKLLGHGQFAIRVVNTQAIKVQDFTADVAKLRNAVGQLGQRGKVRPDGDQILEGVGEAARELFKRKSSRGVIVLFTVYGENKQTVDPEDVLRDLKNSSASLNAMYLAGANAAQMIGDGPRQSGGRIEMINAGSGIVPAASKIANSLLHQMTVTYTLPEGVKPADRLQLTSTRRDVKLVYPTRIPDKF